MGSGRGNRQILKVLAEKRGISFDEDEFSKLSEMLKEVPDIRMDKVNKVREQIMSGSYNPPLEKIVSASSLNMGV